MQKWAVFHLISKHSNTLYLLYELLMSLRNVVRLFISLETSEMFRHFLYALLKKLSLSLGLLG